MATAVASPLQAAPLREAEVDAFQQWLQATDGASPDSSSSFSSPEDREKVQDDADAAARWERWLAATEDSPADASRQHSLLSYWSTVEIQGAAASPLQTPSSSASEYSCIAVKGTPLEACSTGAAAASTPLTGATSASALDQAAKTRSASRPSPVNTVLQLMVDQAAPSLTPEGSYELLTPARNLHRAGFGTSSSSDDEDDDVDGDDDGASSCASDSSDEFISVNELAALGVVDLDHFKADPATPLVRQLVDLLVTPSKAPAAAAAADASE